MTGVQTCALPISEHFADPLHGKLYDSLSRLIERGQVVSAVTLKTYVEQDPAMKEAGGAAYLARLAAASVHVIDAAAVFSREAHLYRADLSVHVGRDLSFTAEAEADDPYPAFDLAAERLAKQLRRHKRKLRDHHRAEGPRTIRE